MTIGQARLLGEEYGEGGEIVTSDFKLQTKKGYALDVV